MSIQIKICGVKTDEAIHAAVKGGVDFLGFNFYPKSPRYVPPEQAAALSPLVPPHTQKVALFVDPSDGELEDTLRIVDADMIQLHGMESPSRIAEIKRIYNKPIIKAIAISTADDLMETVAYETIVNWFLFDARPPKGSELTGGNAVSFDWNIMKDYASHLPWMLAGGINATNIRQAITQSGATAIDVSSGVEITRGVKDAHLIAEFLGIAKTLSSTCHKRPTDSPPSGRG